MSSSIEDLFKMTLLMNLKSNDSAIDTIMIIMLLSCFQYMFSQNFQKIIKEYLYDFYDFVSHELYITFFVFEK